MKISVDSWGREGSPPRLPLPEKEEVLSQRDVVDEWENFLDSKNRSWEPRTAQDELRRAENCIKEYERQAFYALRNLQVAQEPYENGQDYTQSNANFEEAAQKRWEQAKRNMNDGFEATDDYLTIIHSNLSGSKYNELVAKFVRIESGYRETVRILEDKYDSLKGHTELH